MIAIVAGVLVLGLADSMVGPYLVLFGADEAGLSPLQIGVLMSVTAVSGMAISTWLGRRYDRAPSRWPALVAVLAPAAGYAVVSTTTSYALLLVLAATLLGAGTAAFPQLFALGAATRGTPVLRSVWSLAWAVGPLIGAALLAWRGFTGLFLATAAGFALVAVPLAFLRATRPAAAPEPAGAVSLPLPVLSFGLFHTAFFAGSIILPLYVTASLGRPSSDVGVLFSVAAVVEIPAALALLALPLRWRREWVILGAMVALVVFFAVVAGSSTMAMLVAATIARGIAIAVVGALGITYFQELLPGAPGRATTLFSNTATAGSLIAGVFGGAVAQWAGYRWALVTCGAVALVACVLLLVVSGRHHEGRMNAASTA